MQTGEYKFSMPGMKETLRVTTKPDYFDQHPGSTELWSSGSPLFPIVDEIVDLKGAIADFSQAIHLNTMVSSPESEIG
jgi:hypothetical protein